MVGIRRVQDDALDPCVVIHPGRQVHHVAQPVDREVGSHGVAGIHQDAWQVRQHRRVRQLALECDEQLLLPSGTGEVAAAAPGADVREGFLSAKGVGADTQAEAHRSAIRPAAIGRVVDRGRVIDGDAVDPIDHPGEAGQIHGRVIVDRGAQDVPQLPGQRGQPTVRELIRVPIGVAHQ